MILKIMRKVDDEKGNIRLDASETTYISNVKEVRVVKDDAKQDHLEYNFLNETGITYNLDDNTNTVYLLTDMGKTTEKIY